MGGIASIAIVALNQPMNKTAMNRAIVLLHSPPKLAESILLVILMLQYDINQDWQRWEDDMTAWRQEVSEGNQGLEEDENSPLFFDSGSLSFSAPDAFDWTWYHVLLTQPWLVPRCPLPSIYSWGLSIEIEFGYIIHAWERFLGYRADCQRTKLLLKLWSHPSLVFGDAECFPNLSSLLGLARHFWDICCILT